MTYPDGAIYKGRFKTLVFPEDVLLAYEEFESRGSGIYKLTGGDYYNGRWKHNEFVSGFVKATFPDFSCFEGRMRKGKRNGMGVHSYQDGHSEKGLWINDKFIKWLKI